MISNAKYNEHTLPLFKQLKLLKLQDIHKLHLGKFMYKTIHNQLPPPITPYFPQNTDIHRYSTRQASNSHIKHRRTAIASIQINFKGPAYWKDLPNELQQSKSIKIFTGKLKRNLLNSY